MAFQHTVCLFLAAVFSLAPLSCASTGGDKTEEGGGSRSKKRSAKGDAETKGEQSGRGGGDQKEASGHPPAPMKKDFTMGKQVRVTMAYANDGALDGTLPPAILGEVLSPIESLSRKEPENIPLAITHMGLLRMGGQVDDMGLFQKRASAGGSQDPWFLIEAGYGAVRRRNFAFGEYLFSKAEKLAKDPYVKAAAAHGFGLRYWADGKFPEAAKEVQRALSLSDSYAPALLSLGFLALRSGDYGGAESLFRRAVGTQSLNSSARLGLATALRLQGKSGEAAEMLRGLAKSRSSDKRLVWNLALALADDPGKRADAQQALKQYFSMPGVFPDLDARANALQNRLNQPPPAPNKAATSPNTGGAPAGGTEGVTGSGGAPG